MHAYGRTGNPRLTMLYARIPMHAFSVAGSRVCTHTCHMEFNEQVQTQVATCYGSALTVQAVAGAIANDLACETILVQRYLTDKSETGSVISRDPVTGLFNVHEWKHSGGKAELYWGNFDLANYGKAMEALLMRGGFGEHKIDL